MAKEDKAMLGLKTGGALSLYPCHTRNIMYIIWCIYCRCGVQDNTIQTIDIQPLPHKLIANQSRYTGSFLGRWDSVERSHSSTPTTPPSPHPLPATASHIIWVIFSQWFTN